MKYPKKSIKNEAEAIPDFSKAHFPALQSVLNALQIPEQQSLLKWVDSPAFNRRPAVALLYRWLLEAVEKPKNSTKEQLYKHLFGEPQHPDHLSAKEDAALRHTASFLFEVVKQWLAWQDWSEDSFSVRLHLYRALRKRKHLQSFDKFIVGLKDSPGKGQRSTRHHLAQYQLQQEHWEFVHARKQGQVADLTALCNTFGAFVALSALRHGCAALDQFSAQVAVSSIDYLPETLQVVGAGRYADVPAVQVYFYCFQLMSSHDALHFSALKGLLAKHSALFPPEEIRDVWLVAINFCIRKFNAGARDWMYEAFKMYRNGLEQGVLLDNHRMSKLSYQNILLLAIASGEITWARQFLEDYRSALAPGERYNAYLFNLALWHFRTNDYPAAQEILRQVEFRDLYYNLDARRMLVRMYYDQGEMSVLDALLHSFTNYLQRHRNIGYHRDLNFNFIRMVQRIMQLLPGDHQKRAKLQQKITQEAYLAERDWLMAICKA
jgi:hypothetical protein